MNIFGIEINAQNVALAFTLVFLVFVVLNGLLGLVRGWKKSVFYLIVSVVVFGLGFGLMTIAISALLQMPIGQWVGGMLSSVYPEVTSTSNAEDIILGILVSQVPTLADAVAAGGTTASFVMGLVSFAIKLVYIIVILILAFTVIKVIADIIWLIIRPKKRNGIRPKKTFGGRMIGLGIGAFKGAVYSLLIFTLIAGVASIATSALFVADSANKANEAEAVMVITDNHATLITLDASEEGTSSGNQSSLFGDLDLEFVSSIVGSYRDSVPGALFSAVKISTVPLDEFLFDGVFSFDVKLGEEVINVKLRKEIETVASAVGKVATQFDIQNVSLEALLNIGEEGEEALKGLVDAISDLSVLKVAIPVALEVGMYSDLLVDGNGNKILGDLFTPEQIPNLSNSLISDIKSIGYTLVDARKIISVFVGESETPKDINTYLNLDSDVVRVLFDEDHLGGLKSIDILAPIGITYLTTLEGIKNSIEEFGLSIDDITNMPEGATWGQEIGKLGDVYIAIQNLLKDPETGRVNIDTEDYTKILDILTEEKVNNFVDVLFTSNIINNSIGALVTFAKEKLLPEEYKDYITIGEGVTFDATECKAFLNAATVLVQSGLLKMTTEGETSISEMLEKMDVDSLARHLSQSTIIRSSLSKALDLILGNLSTGEISLRFGKFEDWDDQASTEVELRSVLKAMKILAKNLFNESGESQGFSINALKGLTEAELENILASRIMSGTIVNFLVDNSGAEGTLSVIGSGVSRVNETPDNWYDHYHTVEVCQLEGNNLKITSANATLDEEQLINHYLVYCNGAYLTSVRTNPGEQKIVDLSKVEIGTDGEGKAVYHTPSNESTYVAYGVNAKRMGVEKYTLSNSTLTINPSNLALDNDINQVNKFNIYADGELIYSLRVSESKPTVINLATIKIGVDEHGDDVFFELKEDTKIEVYGYNEGELRKIFIAILAITSKLGEEDLDFSNTDNLTSALSKIEDSDIEKITYSVVINDALISAIEDLSTQEGAVIYVPQELKNGENKIDHDKWQEADESSNILKAIKLVFNGGSIDTNSLKLKKIIDDKDDILKSLVICETIKQNIVKVEGISIPINEGLDGIGLTGWKNTYLENGDVDTKGEISLMLDAITNVITITDETTINNINTDSLKLKSIIDNRDEILKSKVISETIRAKLIEVEGINIPTGEDLSSTDLTGWKNVYNESGIVSSHGELSYLLNAISYVITITDDTTVNNINTDSLKLSSVISHRDDILKSKVISETIRAKLIEVEGINIPAGEDLSSTDLVGWKNIYNSSEEVVSHGELSHLLNAINYAITITDETTVNNINTDSLKLKTIIDNRDEILKSKVISETIRAKLIAVEGINIPADEGLSSDNLTGWKNTYDANDALSSRGELSYLLNAIKYVINITDETTVNSIDTNTLKIKPIVDNRNEILKSKVISETIRAKLVAVEGIDIPANEGLSTTNLTGWKNTYDESGNVSSIAELSILLQAVGIVLDLTDETTINNIDTNSIKLKNVIDSRDIILRSKVICETVKAKLLAINDIDIPADEGLSTTDLTGWKNTYDGEWNVTSHGEISKLLYSIQYVISVDENTTINSINTNSIKLKALISHTDDVLKSVVITNTVKTKLLAPSTGISVPAGEGLSTENLTGWKNTYNEAEEVTSHGEVDALLKSVNYILELEDNTSIDTLNVSTIKLKRIVTYRDEILRSVVITNTIRDKLLGVSGINIPTGEGLSTENLTGWKNIYDESEALDSRGEISHLLGAVEKALEVDDNTTLDSLSTNNIKVKKIITNRDDILVSLILSETIRVKLKSIGGVSIPTNDGISADNLTGWKNIYGEADVLISHGEISRLLKAIDIMFEPDEDKTIDTMNVNDISLKHIIDNCDEILKSLILANTIKDNVCANSTGVSVPSDESLSATNLTGWKNIYNSDEYATEYGELHYLLKAIDAILQPTASDKLNNIAISIKLGNIIDGKVVILHSKVISETIKVKIVEASTTGTLKLPANYATSSSPNYISWNNTYTDTYSELTHLINSELTTTGELYSLLSSVGDLLKEADRDKEFSAIGSLDYAKLFDPLVQRDIISSKIISETIINRLEGIAALSIPASTHIDLLNANDRSDWWDLEVGELLYFLNSIGTILTDEQKSNLDSFSLDINSVYANLVNEEKRTTLLSSYVIADTLRANFYALDALKKPTVANAGIDLANDTDAWYLISDTRVITHKELWNLITSIQLLLGNDFDDAKEFTLEDLLGNEAFIPTLDANKVNSNDNIHTFLQSKLVEETFVQLAKSILTGEGVMANYISAPTGGYIWYEHLYETNYDPEDDTYEYDLQTILESLYEMNAAGLSYSAFGNAASLASTISSIDRAKVSDAFVISRTFRGSIASTFNMIFSDVYAAAYAYGAYNGTPIDPWADVQFVQSDYNKPVTKAVASATLKNSLDTVINNINSVY